MVIRVAQYRMIYRRHRTHTVLLKVFQIFFFLYLDRSAGAIYLKLEVKAIQVASLTLGGGKVRAQKLFTLSFS